MHVMMATVNVCIKSYKKPISINPEYCSIKYTRTKEGIDDNRNDKDKNQKFNFIFMDNKMKAMQKIQ